MATSGRPAAESHGELQERAHVSGQGALDAQRQTLICFFTGTQMVLYLTTLVR